MFKYFEPNRIFSITSRAPKYVLSLFIIVLSVGLAEALMNTMGIPSADSTSRSVEELSAIIIQNMKN